MRVRAELIMGLWISLILIAVSLPLTVAQSSIACVATPSSSPRILNFDFSPKELILDNASSHIVLQTHAANENEDIDSIETVFFSPSQNQSIAAIMNSTNLFSGDARNGNYTTNMSFFPSSEAGIWILKHLIVCDKLGECNRIDGTMAETLGFPAKLQIRKDAQNGGVILDPNELRGWANTDRRFAAQRKIIINSVFNRPAICWP
jgi:hypothetical protein